MSAFEKKFPKPSSKKSFTSIIAIVGMVLLVGVLGLYAASRMGWLNNGFPPVNIPRPLTEDERKYLASLDAKTPAEYLKEDVVDQKDGKVLAIPYFNQCLEPDQTTLFPHILDKNNKEACKNMCSAAVMIMIGGYFKKLEYDPAEPHTLKKYMYSDAGQNISDTCGTYQGGAFGLIATETDRQTKSLGVEKTDCNSGNILGMRKYAQHLGLYTQEIPLDLTRLKKAIDRGNPVIISIKQHITLVKGYSKDTLMVNDPYRDTEKDAIEYSYSGKGALYDLPTTIFQGKEEKFIYALEVASAPLETNFKFALGDTVTFKVKDSARELSVRSQPCDTSSVVKIQPGLTGEVIEEPRTLEFCSLSNASKNWYKIRWLNGVEGWSIEPYISKS